MEKKGNGLRFSGFSAVPPTGKKMSLLHIFRILGGALCRKKRPRHRIFRIFGGAPYRKKYRGIKSSGFSAVPLQKKKVTSSGQCNFSCLFGATGPLSVPGGWTSPPLCELRTSLPTDIERFRKYPLLLVTHHLIEFY